MRHRGAWLLLLVAAGASEGCLPDGRPVEGRLLVAGRSIEKPGFVEVNGEPWVMYEVRTAQPVGTRSAAYSLYMVNYETAENLLLLENVADSRQWPPQLDSNRIRYYMVNETAIEGGAAAGVLTPVATLTRFDLGRGVVEEIADVSSCVVKGAEWWYRKIIEGERLPILHYRFKDGSDRTLGPSNGSVFSPVDGRVYWVGGDDHTLRRITSPTSPVKDIRNKVNRFLLNDDETWVVLQTTDPGKAQTVVRSLDTGDERPIPGANTCCWMSFSGGIFVYSESATASSRGKLHLYNVITEEDQKITLPAGLSDVSSIVPRPNSREALYIDSRGRVALVRGGDEENGVLLALEPVALSYTEDGRYLIYIDPETQQPLEGRLMVQDADFKEPAHQISPESSLVPDNGYFFVPEGPRRILVFWGHVGRNASDLYFSNHETGDIRSVAEGISEVTVTARRVVGIVRISGQDLVGDLVNKDVLNNQEIVLAHRVAEATVWGTRVAFVVRERVTSPQDGLWATGIEGIRDANKVTP